MTEKHTTPDPATKAEDAKDAKAHKDPGQMPTEAEERAAEANEPARDSVARAAREQYERGANHPGEGRVP